MNSRSKARLTLTIGIAVAALFLWLSLRGTELGEIRSALGDANPIFVPFVAAALMLQFWFKAQRWGFFLKPFATGVTTRRVFPATVIGYLANLVFPLYVGELARAYVLGRHLNLEYSSVLATTFLERLFDLLAILFIVGLVLGSGQQVPREIEAVGQLAALLSVVLILSLGAFLVWTKQLTHLAVTVTSAISQRLGAVVAEQLALAGVGLSAVRNAHSIPKILLVSLLQWAAMGACIIGGMLGTGVDAPWSAGFVVLALTVMAVTLPSSPGFFGTIQLSFAIGLSAYGVDPSLAFAASVYFHLTIYVVGWLAGLLFLRRSGTSLSGLREAAERSE